MRFSGLKAALWCGSAVLCLTAVPAGAGETRTYTYDALGRVVGQVSTGTVNANVARTYCYDQAGNRTRMVSDASGALAACPAIAPTPTPTPGSSGGLQGRVVLPIAGFYGLRVR